MTTGIDPTVLPGSPSRRHLRRRVAVLAVTSCALGFAAGASAAPLSATATRSESRAGSRSAGTPANTAPQQRPVAGTRRSAERMRGAASPSRGTSGADEASRAGSASSTAVADRSSPSHRAGNAPDAADVARRAVQARPLPASSSSLEGVVTRLWLDPTSTDAAAGHTDDAMATWVVGDGERVEVPSGQLNGVTSGSLVRVGLAAAPADHVGPRRVVRAEVLQAVTPDGAAPGAAGGVVGGTTASGATAATSSAAATSTTASTASTASTTSTTSTASTASPHTATVVLVRPGNLAADSMTLSALKTRVAEASTFWNAQTRGRVTVSVAKAYTNSATADWLSTRATCDQYMTMWNEVATKVGFTPGARNHLILYVPTTASACKYAGLGTIGSGLDSGGYLYVKGNMTALVAHELGHNLSLGHSNGLQCDGKPDGVPTRTVSGSVVKVTWTNGCAATEYRDWFDVMGTSWGYLGTLSSYHARRLGVVPDAQVASVTGPARVTLAPVGSTSGVISAQVKDPSGVVYTVEYRPASGADSWLAGNPRGLVPGVLVRRPDPAGDGGPTLLLDGSPSAASAWAGDWNEPVAPATSLVTASGRTKLTVTSQTSSAAVVTVTMDGVAPAAVGGASQPRDGATVQVAPASATGVRVRAGAGPVTVVASVATPRAYTALAASAAR